MFGVVHDICVQQSNHRRTHYIWTINIEYLAESYQVISIYEFRQWHIWSEFIKLNHGIDQWSLIWFALINFNEIQIRILYYLLIYSLEIGWPFKIEQRFVEHKPFRNKCCNFRYKFDDINQTYNRCPMNDVAERNHNDPWHNE